MKRIFLLLVAALLVVSMAACGKNDTTGSNAAPANNGTAANKTDEASSEKSGDDTTKTADGETGWAMIPGTLNFIDLKEGEEPVIKGLRLAGNRSGSAETEGVFNFKAKATEGIRSIFELNEYVEVYPDTVERSFGILVVEHLEDQTTYETLTFTDGVAVLGGTVAFNTFEKPENTDDCWGEFYLNTDEVKEGYYDFIFIVGTKPVATLLTRFYAEGALEAKSDVELEQIQKGLEPLKVK